MSVQSWAALIVSICTIVAFAAGSIKWLVKHYLNELRPNSGSSLKDQVGRLEKDVVILKEHMIREEKEQDDIKKKLDKMYDILLDFISNNK
jgi:hypothetical protein